MTVTQNKIIAGTAIMREVGGVAGTHEVQIYHDGTNGTAISKLGNLSLQPASGKNLIVGPSTYPNADGTSGQYLYTNGAGTLNWASYGNALSFSAGTLSFRQSAALSVVGNPTNATANVADITATASSNQVLMVSASGTTLTWNTIQTANIAASAVTYAKIQNEGTTTLLGNPTGAGAAPSEIVLGSNLSFSSGTLNLAAGTGGNSTLHGTSYTSSTSFTVPSGAISSTIFKFTITGGGGGGGGGAGGQKFGSPGGAGATAIYSISGLTAGSSMSFTIGAAGTGGASGVSGGAGGNSSITVGATTVTANGGGGGTSSIFVDIAASGGTASNGSINIAGGDGENGATYQNSSSDGGGWTGGKSYWGGGGGMTIGTGRPGVAYGSGGGGGYTGANAGGAGAAGFLLIEWAL